MAHGRDELAWDHTADSLEIESSPLLGRSQGLYGAAHRTEEFHLSKQQVEYMLRSLDDSRTLLQSYLVENYETTKSRTHAEHRRSPSKGERIKNCFLNNLFAVTVLLQVFNLTILTVLDLIPKEPLDHKIFYVSESFMIVSQILNLGLIIFTSVKLSKQFLVHRVNSHFLAQNYFATVLVFAGLYTATYRINRNSWKAINEDIISTPTLILELYQRMAFLSVSTATLCGCSDVYPRFWYNYLILSIQMLLSFVYFASILSQVLAGNVLTPSQQPPSASERQRVLSESSPRDTDTSMGASSHYGSFSSSTERR